MSDYKKYIIVKKIDLPEDKKYQGLSKNDEYEHLNTLDTLGVPMGEVEMTEEEAKFVEALPQVEFVEEVQEVSIPEPVEADDALGFQSIQYHNAPQVWEKGFKGAGIKVAVLDTGLDQTHANTTFSGRVAAAESFVGDGTWHDRQSGHGTHCAGVVADAANKYGMAPECTLLIGKVLGDDGSGTTTGIIRGINWAIANGAHVISMSLGGRGTSTDSMSLAVDAARDKGVLVACAAGNDQRGKTSYTADVHTPGAAKKSITVAAVNVANSAIADFSSWGTCVDIAGSGVGVVSLGLNGSLNRSMSGTSMATPHIAGGLALLLDAKLNPDAVENAARVGAKDTSLEGYKEGHGIMDVLNSLNILGVEQPTPTPDPETYYPDLPRVNLSAFNKKRGELLEKESVLYILVSGENKEIGRYEPKDV